MSDFGLLVYDAAGQLNFSIKGRTPRYHSSGTIVVPRAGNATISGAIVYIVTIPVPDITNPAEWWILDVPSSGSAYAYLFNDLHSFNISVGSIQIIIGLKQTTYDIPFRYVLVNLK